MGYTAEQANIELRKIVSGDNSATKEELLRIINQLDILDNYASANAKTVLYSGYDVKNLTQDPRSHRPRWECI